MQSWDLAILSRIMHSRAAKIRARSVNPYNETSLSIRSQPCPFWPWNLEFPGCEHKWSYVNCENKGSEYTSRITWPEAWEWECCGFLYLLDCAINQRVWFDGYDGFLPGLTSWPGSSLLQADNYWNIKNVDASAQDLGKDTSCQIPPC